MYNAFEDFDLGEFWSTSDYGCSKYSGNPIMELEVCSVENSLGYQLPSSYIELLHSRNGGVPKHTCHRVSRPTSWARDHIAISGIYGIDSTLDKSLVGLFNTEFWIREWGYPGIGIYICDCPSGGHDLVALDYRGCGTAGEPTVVYVDQEFDYAITPVAENFESFIRGLQTCDDFE